MVIAESYCSIRKESDQSYQHPLVFKWCHYQKKTPSTDDDCELRFKVLEKQKYKTKQSLNLISMLMYLLCFPQTRFSSIYITVIYGKGNRLVHACVHNINSHARLIFRDNTKGTSSLQQTQWPNKLLFTKHT